MRVVDAVKGPFHPSPPPLPTYLEPPTKCAEGELPNQIFAPVSDKDAHLYKEPDDPY